MRVAWPSPGPGTWVPQVHANCAHNQVAALKLRVLAPLPRQVNEALGVSTLRAWRKLQTLARAYPDGRWTIEQTAESYEGALRRRYRLAADSLQDVSLRRQDARLDCFLKAEKIAVTEKWAKPRLIFPRSPRYNLVLASRLKPFEHWLWGNLTAERIGISGVGRLCAKGLTPTGRANLIAKKMARIPGCVVLEVDGKAFEAHVGKSSLEEEHRTYRAAFPGDRKLRSLLRHQLVLKGRLPCGARFSRPGGRASGDFNTGMGNSLVMMAGLMPALRRLANEYDMLVDGDNALVFLSPDCVDHVMANLAATVVADCGQELTLERPTTIFEEVTFGQSNPVWFPQGPRMVRNPYKVMSGATASHRWLREPVFAREYLAGVALCELSLAQGVPVLQAFSKALYEGSGHQGRVREHPLRDYFMIGASVVDPALTRPVHPDTRVSFERAFGIPPEAQVQLEQSFASFRFAGTQWGALQSWTDRFEAPPGAVDGWIDARV